MTLTAITIGGRPYRIGLGMWVGHNDHGGPFCISVCYLSHLTD